MTSTVTRLDSAPTDHPGLLRWVRDTAELTEPDEIVWCDGSPEEWQRLTEQLVAAGTLIRLDPPAGDVYAEFAARFGSPPHAPVAGSANSRP